LAISLTQRTGGFYHQLFISPLEIAPGVFMNNAIQQINEITNQVIHDINVTTELIGTGQAASNDALMINGQSITITGIPANYEVRDSGLYYIEGQEGDGISEGINISACIVVTGFSKNENTKSWSRNILIKDFSDEWQKLSICMGEVSGNPKRLSQILSNKGLDIEESQIHRLYDYVAGCKPTQRVTNVDKPGWHNDEYVMPDCLDAIQGGKYIYQAPSRSKNLFPSAGTLSDWKANVASMCTDNSRLLFAGSTAFGSLMLQLTGGVSCGFHFSASSSRGKTTALKVGKSVCGSPKDLVSWRTTDNALESIAAEHNNSILCIDELGQMAETNLKRVGDTIYMLGNEEGKSRYKLSDELKTWRLYYLSSGESSLRDAFSRSDKSATAGQEVRFVDISADTQSGHGIFDTVHGYANGQEFADTLNENVEQYHGSAARAFIAELTADKELYISYAQDVKTEFLQKLNLGEVEPQVRRVAEHIAIIVAAGELASEMGITGWEYGQVSWAGEECFNSWLEMRGGNDSQEAEMGFAVVQDKLIRNGHSKFITDDKPAPRGQYWGKREGNNYFIFTQVFDNQICKGLNPRYVKDELVQRGFITQGAGGRNSVTKRIDGKPVRCIHINETFFSAVTEDVA
tara:strand:+ start:224 stop:2119 length:1896 start_codon:yes stop_codon:yes gene_type:complete